jgi:hypothetical protein
MHMLPMLPSINVSDPDSPHFSPRENFENGQSTTFVLRVFLVAIKESSSSLFDLMITSSQVFITFRMEVRIRTLFPFFFWHSLDQAIMP